MSLQSEIDAVVSNFMAGAPAGVRQSLYACIDRLIKSGIAHKALNVGDKAPNFTLPNAYGSQVTLCDRLHDGPVVLVFYRGGWCPFCNLQLHAYQKALSELHTYQAALIGISPQVPAQSLSTAEKNALDFDVLSDVGNKIAATYGLVFSLEPEIRQLYQQLGADLPRINGDESWTLPITATYIVNRDAAIVWAHVNANYLERAEPHDVLQVLRTVANNERKTV